MGTRGQFSKFYGKTGGIPIENRQFSCIEKIGNIKILQNNIKSNNPTPTYSNTMNTTYFIYSKKTNRIERILYYKKHKLVKSVDFKKGETPHTHYWNNNMVGRKRHDKKNLFELNSRDKRLYNLAKSYNDNKKDNNN